MIGGGIYRPSPLDETLAPFISIWETTAAGETLQFPVGSGYPVNCEVDWGDGSIETITTTSSPSWTHTYATAGEHTITITGTFPSIYINANDAMRNKLMEVVQLGEVGWRVFSRAFMRAERMRAFVVGIADTSAVTTIDYMLSGCDALTIGPDLTGFDVSSVITMIGALGSNLFMTTAPDVSNWNTSNCTKMQQLFIANEVMTTPPDVSGWDTSKVTDFTSMFAVCRVMSPSPDMSAWDTGQLLEMDSMFSRADGVATTVVDSLVNWDISNLEGSTNMFDDVTLPTLDYDRWLISMAAQTVKMSVILGAGDTRYTAGGAAETAHDTLDFAPNNWSFQDLGSI